MSIKKFSLAAWLSWVMLAGLVAGCVDPFSPDVASADASYLVVDGFINTRGITTIRLSRTFGLGEKKEPVETSARLFIEDEQGAQYPLAEGVAGSYASAALQLTQGRRYRLHLFTANGQEFASEYVAAKVTPAIDAITWEAAPDQLRLMVSTHDDSNQSVYYRWSYDETWEFVSAFEAAYEYAGGSIRQRQENIYQCWTTSQSTSIRLGNTTQLGRDVVTNAPLLDLPRRSVKLRVKYSVLVKQYAQTREEYNYWEQLRKNTESLGTIFGPLPSETTGNVRGISDASAKVLGFVGVTSVTEKRLFISRQELPQAWWASFDTGYDPNCFMLDTLRTFEEMQLIYNYVKLPVEELTGPGGRVTGYLAGSVDCLDCRRRGTNVRPAFWR